MIHAAILRIMNDEHIKDMHRQADQHRLATNIQNKPTNAKNTIKILTSNMKRLKSSKLQIEFKLQVRFN